MREQVAKTKWCPMVRFDSAGNDWRGTNRGDGIRDDGPSSICIASDCMAWRWYPHKTEHGYCGLAGEPAADDDGR